MYVYIRFESEEFEAKFLPNVFTMFSESDA